MKRNLKFYLSVCVLSILFFSFTDRNKNDITTASDTIDKIFEDNTYLNFKKDVQHFMYQKENFRNFLNKTEFDLNNNKFLENKREKAFAKMSFEEFWFYQKLRIDKIIDKYSLNPTDKDLMEFLFIRSVIPKELDNLLYFSCSSEHTACTKAADSKAAAAVKSCAGDIGCLWVSQWRHLSELATCAIEYSNCLSNVPIETGSES